MKRKNTVNQAKKKDIKIHQTIKISIDKQEMPKDVKFKSWEDIIGQDIVFEIKNNLYTIALYYSPSLKKTYRAKSPKG